ncbi:MAG TPA: hypothetical protein VEL07_16320 [Planctomycetota bacterium]|nr:hypothetical protein [Planctomycetota bacterium]
MTTSATASTRSHEWLIVTALTFVALLGGGCQRTKTAGEHIVVLENRSNEIVMCDRMAFDGSVVGGVVGTLKPGDVNTDHYHTWQITERVDVLAGIYPNDGTLGTEKFDRKRIDRRTLSCDVLTHMSRSDRQLLWFIVNPDLTLRVVVLPGDRFAAMEKSGERPE